MTDLIFLVFFFNHCFNLKVSLLGSTLDMYLKYSTALHKLHWLRKYVFFVRFRPSIFCIFYKSDSSSLFSFIKYAKLAIFVIKVLERFVVRTIPFHFCVNVASCSKGYFAVIFFFLHSSKIHLRNKMLRVIRIFKTSFEM